MDYDALVQSIQSSPVLNDAVKDLEKRTRSTNLIVSDWQDVLKKHPVYQLHEQKKVKYSKGHSCANEKAYVRNVIHPDEQFNIIVAGEWSLSQGTDDFSIVARQCQPLQMVGLAMQENPLWKLHDAGRFFVKICEPRFCHACSESHIHYNVPFVPKNWCVLSTHIFDGHTLRNEFTHPLQQSMLRMGNFLGIFHMQILSRTTFGDDVFKIGGHIKEMIVFQSSALISHNVLNFKREDLQPPQIEFPEQEKFE